MVVSNATFLLDDSLPIRIENGEHFTWMEPHGSEAVVSDVRSGIKVSVVPLISCAFDCYINTEQTNGIIKKLALDSCYIC